MMKHKGDWLLLLAAFIGGGGFISLKYLLDWGYDPFQVIFGRFLTASVCMCLVYCKRLKRITKEEWRVGSILGALLAAMFLLMTVGLQYTTPSVNAFLVNIPAVIVPFVCWGVFRQKPNRNCFLAAGMTLFGVCCLSLTADFRLDFGAGGTSTLIYQHPDPTAKVEIMRFARKDVGSKRETDYNDTFSDYGHSVFRSLGIAFNLPNGKGEFVVLNLNSSGRVDKNGTFPSEQVHEGFGSIKDIMFI